MKKLIVTLLKEKLEGSRIKLQQRSRLERSDIYWIIDVFNLSIEDNQISLIIENGTGKQNWWLSLYEELKWNEKENYYFI